MCLYIFITIFITKYLGISVMNVELEFCYEKVCFKC